MAIAAGSTRLAALFLSTMLAGCATPESTPADRATARSALRPGPATAVEPTSSGWVRPVLSAAGPASAIVELSIDGPPALRLRDPEARVAIEVKLHGAGPASAMRFAGGIASYGPALALRPDETGVEDFLLLDREPPESALHYEVDVSRVKGLRLQDRVLEFLDEGGAPRLRMARPYVESTRKHGVVRRDASVEVRGCAVDADPRPPWGRRLTPIGASACEVIVRWDARGLDYPLLVDPAWTLTSSTLVTKRSEHGAALMTDPAHAGQVLVAGGWDGIVALSSAEIYNPALKTWSAVPAMAQASHPAVAVTLPDSRVLVVGGALGAQLFNPATGMWGLTAPNTLNGGAETATLLKDGRVLARAAGMAQLYDPNADKWTTTGPVMATLGGFTADLLLDGRVLVAGGYAEKKAEIYDPGTDTWSLAATMSAYRGGHRSALLKTGKVLVAGGEDDFGDPTTSTELYDPVANKWQPGGSMINPREWASLSPLPNGALLMAGGYQWAADAIVESELYDPDLDKWFTAPDMMAKRALHTATTLLDGTVLVAGGEYLGLMQGSELFALDPLGKACLSAVYCATGLCADHVCCDQACDAPCVACTAAEKGSGSDGTCGALPAGATDSACPMKDPTTCDTTGVCAAGGQCAYYAASTECAPPSCMSGSVTVSACDGQGTCAQQVTSCAPYACGGPAACATACSDDTPCAPSAWCDAAQGACEPGLVDATSCTRDRQCMSGKCIQGTCASGAICVDEHTLESPDAKVVECAPYLCQGSACKTTCNSILDCVAPTVCDAKHECIPLPYDTGTPIGCGCRAAGRSEAPDSVVLLAIAAAALGRRDRGRRRVALPTRGG